MHRLVPRFILQNYASNEYHGRFPATALFIDIAGFTAITDTLMQHGQHGSEVMAVIMRTLFQPLVASVYARGGFIVGFAGDAFTALFDHRKGGRQQADLQALAAAWEMQNLMAEPELRIQSTPYGEFVLGAKIGLASGWVSWGIVTSEGGDQASYYFRGSAVDESAAAEHLASPGQIVLNNTLFNSFQSQVEVVPCEGYFLLTAFNCALPVSKPISLPAPDPHLMSHFFPSSVTQIGISGEFRQVVNLFIGLPTLRSKTQLERFMHAVFPLQKRYGGLLNRLDFGDKGAYLLLFWGSPMAYENDVQRALNFLLDLQAQTTIPFHAGVTYQVAHTGIIGSGLRAEYTCHGRGVNLAARFMTSAPRGTIWVDENVVHRSGGEFDLTFEGELGFKGFSLPQKVYTLTGRQEDVSLVFDGPWVGREQELETLFEFVQPLVRGEFAGMLLVSGDAGAGKSRLAYEFVKKLRESEQAQKARIAFFQAQSDEILRQPLNPIRYWLKRYFGLSEYLSESHNKRNFNHRLDALIAKTADKKLAKELARTRSFLGALVGLRWPDSLYEQFSAKERYENSIIGVIALTQAESQRRPLLFCLEDIHWLDDDSKVLLSRLLQALDSHKSPKYPVALLVTTRLESDSSTFIDFDYQELRLGGLDRIRLAWLAEAQLGGPVAEPLLDLLEYRAEGNPFFSSEVLRDLQYRGFLLPQNGGWTVAKGGGETLPTDIRVLLIARLDRLTAEIKELVQTAAVLGREFELRLLSGILRDDPDLPERVNQGIREQIWVPIKELRYLFKHALLRDVAYRMQVRERRQSLHALAMLTIEQLHADDLDRYYDELAYHAEQAGLKSQALNYLQLAGDAAASTYQNTQALDYYDRALALLDEEELEARYTLLSCRYQIYQLIGERTAQLGDLTTLTQLTDRLDDDKKRAETAERLANYHFLTSDYTAAINTAKEAIQLAEGAETPIVKAMATLRWGLSLWRQGSFQEAEDRLKEVLALTRQIGERDLESTALLNLANITSDLGDYATAREQYQQALEISRQLGDRATELNVVNNLGIIAADMGDYPQAREYFEQSMAIAQETGNRHGEGLALTNLGFVTADMKDYAASKEYFELTIEHSDQIDNRLRKGYALTGLGEALCALGEYEAAADAFQKAVEIRRALGQDHLAILSQAGHAGAVLAQGKPSKALSLIEDVLPFLETQNLMQMTTSLTIRLTCFRILQANKDPRTAPFLESSYNLLQKHASKIEDEGGRYSFLEKVDAHRQLANEWEVYRASK